MSEGFDDVVGAARAVRELPPGSAARQWAETRLLEAAAAVDLGSFAADALRNPTEAASRWYAFFGELGAHGEAVAAAAAEQDGWVPVYQAPEPGANGIDLVLFHPASEEVRVVEVKTTTGAAGFRTRRTKDGQQGDEEWVAKGLTSAGLEGLADYDGLSVVGAQIKLREGKISWLSRDDASGRSWSPIGTVPYRAETPPVPSSDADERPHGGGGSKPPSSPPAAAGAESAASTEVESNRSAGQAQAADRKRLADEQKRAAELRRAEAERARAAARQQEREQRAAAEQARAAEREQYQTVVPGDRRIPAGDSRFAG